MPRGGKRPGAGAPRGNLNTLKSGKHSAQISALAEILGAIPDLRSALLSYGRHQARRKQKDRQAALSLLITLLIRAKFNQWPATLKAPVSASLAAKFSENNQLPNPETEVNQSPPYGR